MKESRLRKLSILSGVNPNDADYPKLQAYIEEFIELTEERNRYVAMAYGLYDNYGNGIDDYHCIRLDRHLKTIERVFADAGHAHLPMVLKKLMTLEKNYGSR